MFDLSYKTDHTKNSFINFQCNLINNDKNACILGCKSYRTFFSNSSIFKVFVRNLANGYHVHFNKVSIYPEADILTLKDTLSKDNIINSVVTCCQKQKQTLKT